MKVFDGLRGLFRLGGQTVDSYGYGLETCVYLGIVGKPERFEKAVTSESYAHVERVSGELAAKKEEQINLYKNWARHSRSRKSRINLEVAPDTY